MPSPLMLVPSSLANPVLRTMFEARKRVFVDLLKWDIPVLEERYEVDQFDTPDAEYLILVDQRGGHRASARLLRTDGPHILADLFPDLSEGMTPAGPSVREITRFCLEPTLSKPERRNARDELVTALAEHAVQNGITDYTGVASEAWFRQIATFGWSCRALGAPRRCGSEDLVALHIRIDAATTASLDAAGIYRPPGCQLATGALQ